jgi:hypothetical protein
LKCISITIANTVCGKESVIAYRSKLNNKITINTKEAHSIHAAITNSHSLHSTVTEMLRKYAGLKDGLIRMWQLKTAYIIPLVPSTTDIITNTATP